MKSTVNRPAIPYQLYSPSPPTSSSLFPSQTPPSVLPSFQPFSYNRSNNHHSIMKPQFFFFAPQLQHKGPSFLIRINKMVEEQNYQNAFPTKWAIPCLATSAFKSLSFLLYSKLNHFYLCGIYNSHRGSSHTNKSLWKPINPESGNPYPEDAQT